MAVTSRHLLFMCVLALVAAAAISAPQRPGSAQANRGSGITCKAARQCPKSECCNRGMCGPCSSSTLGPKHQQKERAGGQPQAGKAPAAPSSKFAPTAPSSPAAPTSGSSGKGKEAPAAPSSSAPPAPSPKEAEAPEAPKSGSEPTPVSAPNEPKTPEPPNVPESPQAPNAPKAPQAPNPIEEAEKTVGQIEKGIDMGKKVKRMLDGDTDAAMDLVGDLGDTMGEGEDEEGGEGKPDIKKMMADAKSGKVPGPAAEKEAEEATSTRGARPATSKAAPTKSAARSRTPTPSPTPDEDDDETATASARPKETVKYYNADGEALDE